MALNRTAMWKTAPLYKESDSMGSTWHSEVGGNGSKEVLRNLFSLWCHKLAICLCKHTHSEEVFSELYGTVNYLYRRSSHKWVKRLLKVSSKLHSDRENTVFPFPEVLIQPYDIKHRYNDSQEKATYGLQKTRVASSSCVVSSFQYIQNGPH